MGERRNRRANVPLTEEEHRELNRAAGACGLGLTDYLRMAGVERARATMGRAVLAARDGGA